MTPKADTKLKKLTFGFKYDTKNLVNFQPTTQVWKFRSFCPKYIRFGLKNTEDCLSWYWTAMQNLNSLTLWFRKWHEELGEISLKHLKFWKMVLWWTFFVQCIKCFSWKISEELCVMTLKGNAKFKGKLTCGL